MPDACQPSSAPDLGPRDRIQRARFLALAPRDRLAAMQELVDRSWAALQAHPPGLAHFLSRNFKARSGGRPPAGGGDGT